MELPDRGGCCISWICKNRFPYLFSFAIKILKFFKLHDHFAPNFYTLRGWNFFSNELKRNGLNGAKILSNVFTIDTIATGGAHNELPPLINEFNRQSIEFGFCDIGNVFRES